MNEEFTYHQDDENQGKIVQPDDEGQAAHSDEGGANSNSQEQAEPEQSSEAAQLEAFMQVYKENDELAEAVSLLEVTRANMLMDLKKALLDITDDPAALTFADFLNSLEMDRPDDNTTDIDFQVMIAQQQVAPGETIDSSSFLNDENMKLLQARNAELKLYKSHLEKNLGKSGIPFLRRLLGERHTPNTLGWK